MKEAKKQTALRRHLILSILVGSRAAPPHPGI